MQKYVYLESNLNRSAVHKVTIPLSGGYRIRVCVTEPPGNHVTDKGDSVMMHGKLLYSLGLVGVIAIYSMGQPSDSAFVIETTKGVETTVSNAYFKMGDIRLINNNWGSRQLECNTPYRIFIENDGTFGWEFNRGACGEADAAPDFPEVEFGLHPFGINKDSVKTQDVSSTTLLPRQIKDINSASIKIDQMNIELQSAKSWNICFEMWLTTKDPVTIDTGECPYAEIMVFWGWQDGRWACDQTGDLTSGGDRYVLCHRGDDWACGWRYIQFRASNGPNRNYNGTLDVKAILDWLVSHMGVSQDYWITRFEIGSEIGDNTSGKVTIKNITFEVNGVSKSPEFRDPSAISEKSRDVIPWERDHAMFPAGTSVEIVNMLGARKIARTGTRPESTLELVKKMPRGVYLVYRVDRKGIRSKKAVVVPVL